MIELDRIATERRNPYTMHIDEVSTIEMLKLINQEDKRVPLAIGQVLPQIAQAVDVIAEHIHLGGRLFYIGAGTSGRLGVVDASECPPTYGTEPELVQGIIAGGPAALLVAQEGAEDSPELCVHDLKERGFNKGDVLVGLAASGRTPYVIGGMEYANSLGAVTISLTCAPGSPIEALAQIPITVVTGPEVITGSTRMKAGTAQKLVLNMLSTATMVRLGKVYGNLMVDLKATNKKLEERSIRIVMEATGEDRAVAQKALEDSQGHAKLAIFQLLSGLPVEKAAELLNQAEGYIARALKLLPTAPKGGKTN